MDKICSSCNLLKSKTEFYQRKTRVNQVQSECKSCCRLRRSRWWKSEAGRLSSTNSKLKARFGITLKEYNFILQKQNYVCLICEGVSSTNGHRLAVDHCHTTGKIRGLLCKSCNIALGNFKDNIKYLEAAINYLKTFEKIKGISR